MERYRSVLEVLRFGTPQDTLRAAWVHSSWRSPSSAQELWRDYCDWAGIPVHKQSAREAYRMSPALEMCTYLASEKNWLHVVDLRTFSLRSVPSELLDNHTTFCQTHQHTYIAISEVAKVYKICLDPEVSIFPLSVPSQCRGKSGLLKYRDFVYAFGGKDSTTLLRTIEKYAVSSDKWVLLPEKMKEARASATACRHMEAVYLVGCCMALEVFHLPTEMCACMCLVLPCWIAWSLAYVEDQVLVVVSEKQLLKGNLCNEERFRISRLEPASSKPDSTTFLCRLQSKDPKSLTLYIFDTTLMTAHLISILKK